MVFVPGELLKEENTVEIFELHAPKNDFLVSCIDRPLLCEPVDSSFNSMAFELK